jgi:hypothetical protein
METPNGTGEDSQIFSQTTRKPQFQEKTNKLISNLMNWLMIRCITHAFKELRYGQAGCINAFKQRQDIV